MNKRALYIVVFVQALFALSLIYLGTQAREARRDEYLELTHRITSGHASEQDFAQAAEHLPSKAGAQVVRSLFGLPAASCGEIKVAGETQSRTGDFWIYFPKADDEPVDPHSIQLLKGPVKCFVVQFNKAGVASAEWLSIVHPLQAK